MRRGTFWSWLWIALGVIYFFVPLVATFAFSLQAKLNVLSFKAYADVFSDPNFRINFLASVVWAVSTIVVGVVLFVPTAYWVRLRLPSVRSVVEYLTLLPFVVPAIVLVYGLVRTFSRPPLPIVNSPLLLIFGYTIMSMPYMYRAVDTGLRAIDALVLTEAAQSLGAGWLTIMLRVIFPNIRVAVLSGSFLTFAIVMGEYTLAQWLDKPAFGPYMALLGQTKAYEPSACAIISFALTWAAMGIMQFIGRGAPGGAQVAAGH
ncbi:MAG: ABC transporter permease subunit [Anaerolineales bacterium]|jgi:putative spermidine/putrescine transport system permease protein